MRGTGVLRRAARALHTSAPAAQALPATASDPPATQGGWLARLVGGPAKEGTPLTDPLPGVPNVPPLAVPAQPPSTDLTTYDNGLKLATENTLVRAGGGQPCAALHACPAIWRAPGCSRGACPARRRA